MTNCPSQISAWRARSIRRIGYLVYLCEHGIYGLISRKLYGILSPPFGFVYRIRIPSICKLNRSPSHADVGQAPVFFRKKRPQISSFGNKSAAGALWRPNPAPMQLGEERGDAGDQRWIQQIASSFASCTRSCRWLIRRASSMGARDGRHLPPGNQPKEIHPSLLP